MGIFNYEAAEVIAKEEGFSYVSRLDPTTMELLDEVRSMCHSNTCRMYDKNWSCPPACGTLEECRDKIKPFTWGILLQTVGEIEDSMDFEGMKDLEDAHKARFAEFVEKVRNEAKQMLPLGSGCCTICRPCAYPAEPCRFPEKRVSSLEAYGILVSDLCKKNGLAYYYGNNTIAYTSCCLLG